MRIVSTIGAVGMLFLSGGAFAAPQLSNERATTILEAAWSEVTVSLYLGPVVVVRDSYGAADHRITQSTLNNTYLPAQQAGAISVVETTEAKQFNQGQSFSWDQWLGSTTEGIVTKVVVSATPAYSKKNISKDDGLLQFSIGSQTVDRIVSNEIIRKGVNDFAVLRVFYRIDWDSAARALYTTCGKESSAEQKAVILLKFDVFTETWKYVTEDYANADGEICTDNVGKALK